ncbi:MAG: LysR family transcriptional regulator [Proteobacteria bacterium]|uniref:LysR substrate-binding domain-containing protein n=1 Tax=Plasticicumulans sp. TaxID=2307179 RepID=UPI002CF0B3B0|nr:LysR family transcriptional regulator [Pseudomonadota bacterium]HND97556.1 LysR substrate-binding domain-containing protein [Plasticicumulans sp.]
MDLRRLRYFVAVAEERHFTRAAERLHIAQPPLSQQIQALEAELGVALFERSRRHVTLTAAGERLLERARALLREAGAAAEEVRRIGRGELGELRIAFTSSLPFSELIPRLLYDYRRRYPDVRLELRDTGTQRQLDLLLAGRLDLGFVRTDDPQLPAGLAWTELHRDPLRLVIHEAHPLAGRSEVAIAELAEEAFVMFPEDSGTGLLRQFHALCRTAGFTPHIVQEAREVSTIIGLVAAGLGLSILPAPLACIGIARVRFLALTDAAAQSIVLLATRAGPLPAAVANFVEQAATGARLGASPITG